MQHFNKNSNGISEGVPEEISGNIRTRIHRGIIKRIAGGIPK